MKNDNTNILIVITIFTVVGILQKISIFPVRCYQFNDETPCYSILEIDFWRFYNTDYNKYGWWQTL